MKIEALIQKEQKRQADTINLIASENYCSKAVRDAAGSVLTNKYAEGMPGKRYYGGCRVVDEVELYSMELAKKLFHAEHVNLQPHAGSSANFTVFMSLLNPGDTIVAMDLASGGHLTHGHRLNFSGKLYRIIGYGLSPQTEEIDYDHVQELVATHRPQLIIAGASAYARIIDFERFGAIARQYKAHLLVDMAHIAGLVAAGKHPSPFPYADIVTSTTHKTLRGPRGGMILCKQELAAKIDRAIIPGTQGGPLMHIIAAKGIAFQEALSPSFPPYIEQVIANTKRLADRLGSYGYRIVSKTTDNHLFLVDLRQSCLINGMEAERYAEACNIVFNRNVIPFDAASPLAPNGIRLGCAAVTTRGMKEPEMDQVASCLHLLLQHPGDEKVMALVKDTVALLCEKFPIPDHYD